MSRAHDPSPTDSLAQRDRRLVTGIAVSALLHGLLLSVQFGIPDVDAGPGGPIRVALAPRTPASDPVPVPAPVPESMPAPIPAPAPATVPPTPAPPPNGLRLVDLPPRPAEVVPLAQAVQPKPGTLPGAKRVRRKLPKLRMPPASAVIASTQQDATFAVAPLLPESAPEVLPSLVSAEPDEKPESDAMATAARADEEAGEEPEPRRQEEAAEAARIAAAEEQQKRKAELDRLLHEQEQERKRLAAQRAEQEQLAARESEAVAQREAERAEQQRRAEQQLAEQRQAQQRLQEQQSAERRQAEQRLAEQLAAEQSAAELRQAEQLAAERARIAQQRLDERRRAEAEQQRLAQLREREEAMARQVEQQRAAERLAGEERTRRQEQARERQRADELAQRQAAEEEARRLAEERARSERVARERAEEAGRRAAEGLQAQALPGSDHPGPGGAGNGRGDGSRPAGSVPGSAMATRARELLRGLSIPNVAPPVRPLDEAPGSRRALADGAERDVPLRLYVDSVRQKLERTATLGGARFTLREVRIDPLVSLTLRSDGSVDDVTIVRSSGRADMDDAVRRFVQLNARYSAFPPNVAARFDIIEIRRVWRFSDGLKLLEEMR